MSSQISLPALIFLVLALNILPSFITAQQFPSHSCSNDNGNYTANSTYQTNLNTLLSSLSTNVGRNGFYNAPVGRNPDRANAIVLCRGDIHLDTCRSCVQNATVDIVSRCPNQRQAVFWIGLCMLRYSNESIVGTMTSNPWRALVNTQNASSVGQFLTDLRRLIDDLRNQAASGGSLWKVAAGNITAPDFQRIFALVQCTCLMDAAGNIPRCCGSQRGVRILTPSCNLRYEIYTFYNESMLREVLEPIPSPPPSIPTQPISPSPPPGSGNNNTTRTTIIIIVLVVAGLILVVFIGFLIIKRIKKKPNEEFQIGEDGDEISFVESLQYEFGIIRAATNDFSEANKLGQGGFGVVYKGKLLNDQDIAVKILATDSGQGGLEFKNEVMLLARLQHRNLVRLLGFSIEGNEKLLVYEFVQNASLDHFIFDFGMARLFVQEETQGNTSRIVGTYGYMAPEYAMHGQFSIKSDVFSFGVLVLEIISGQKNNCFRNGENIEDLISSAWKNWRDGMAANLIDPILRGIAGVPRDSLRCIHIGLLCVQENAANRPTMASVVLMLNSSSISLPVPSQPAFYMPSSYESETCGSGGVWAGIGAVDGAGARGVAGSGAGCAGVGVVAEVEMEPERTGAGAATSRVRTNLESELVPETAVEEKERRAAERIEEEGVIIFELGKKWRSSSGLREVLEPIPSPPPGAGSNNTTRTTIIIIVSVVAGLILAVFIGFLIIKRIKQKPNEEFQNVDEISFVESLQYEFGKIRAATNDFSEANKLGQGGFGVVYKGKLLNDQEIAVKRLSRDSGQGFLEFKNEVMLLARLQHRNLVRLLDFSIEGNEKLLVYEFVQNASLDHFIFDPTKRSDLDWDRRCKIIGGIARGLLYLHEDSRLRIIHRDLKAGNVLLDGELNPKIADFGMAKLFVQEETQGNTSRIVGTYGYMAPEYAMHGQFSVKSDVFSFGVLVLEIISGQKNNCFRNGENIEDLISSVSANLEVQNCLFIKINTTPWKNWRDGMAANLIDPMLRGIAGVPRDILRCIHIGLLCVQENAANRPTMASVVLMLNSFSITLPIPSEPAFYMPGCYESEVSLIQEFNSRELDSENLIKIEKDNFAYISENDASITDLYPR
ncbi:hypothetical protein RD792_007769 [Penstemon davidsonii]|uniref:Cysteine-rich receptor-like protein kinase 29 n=1 Tax=Penstemon davidsonii TaxID=160366 RepID=A0ABR0D8N1_9LAMI|nr:hypothetical protein RD792_007769 [Penstemon davidsonii]